VLVEPDQRDSQLYLANTFGYAQRRQLAEHAYQQTRTLLRARRKEIAPQLARHGITLDAGALADPHRHLWEPRGATSQLGRAVASLHATLDDLELALHPA
jgi:hypothetical protein